MIPKQRKYQKKVLKLQVDDYISIQTQIPRWG